MKYETTYKEMSEIFGLIAKAEEQVNSYLEACKNYDEASFAYCESGFLPSVGAEMSIAFEKKGKAEKSLKNSYKKLLAAFGVNDDDGYEANYLRQFASRIYEPYRFLEAAKREARRLMSFLD